ncbi:HD domain-containing phosphohydrolase [Marichromatium bheemlicum]|uniref:Response regulator n=1 Tax=Marichromatium bheemlicum TaxID=365339 RepID=A0ABX1I9K9_9GAMM|nr:HD domain-containing phosphohydrolase [Marichromatium bheemlicum]NKN33506.1 response regulator [Marichromatium bheemlicum]
MQHGKLLVVDDEPSNLGLIDEILGQDYRLAFARNGQEALAAVAKHQPAMLLLDVQMPDMDGYEVCRRLKATPAGAQIPVLFITSRSDEIDENEAFEAGGVDFITKPISPLVLKARVRTHLSLVRATDLERSQRDAIDMLARAGHFRDNDTGVHIWRMADYSTLLAEACGWPPDEVALMKLAAPMHDTGKMGIPDAILQKPAKLDATEWAVMKTHAQIGHDILARSEARIFKLAAEIALHHHERWDGSGYPDGLAGTAIPQSARIVAVADVFDALSMRRPYKEPWPVERVVETLNAESGHHFDPELIERFNESLDRILEIKATWDAREVDEFD